MKVRVGIIGVSGYGGGETLRLCAAHPEFQVVYVAGESSAGAKLTDRYPALSGALDELRIEQWDPRKPPQLDLIFASMPTGKSRETLAGVSGETRIVDLGGDHRHVDGWTYGLADIWPEKIRGAKRVANPGCYPTAALTAIAPLLASGMVKRGAPIIIDAKSGVSGAGRGSGQGGESTFSFAELNEDVSPYGLIGHPHVPEIRAAATILLNFEPPVTFSPHLIPMTRGILATCYLAGDADSAACLAQARTFYADKQFVRVTHRPPHTKWANGSNFVFVSYSAGKDDGIIVAMTAIDNLVKGAAGQAVQNANLMLGFSENIGLGGLPIWP